MTKRERGYNLIELLIAIAMLGVVMLTILSLFVWGRKNVYSGKQMTTAISIGTRVMEDLSQLTKEDIYKRAFSIADDDSGDTIKVGNPLRTYTNAAARSTNASAIPGYSDTQLENADGPLFLAKWKKQLDDDVTGGSKKERLLDGAVTVIMMPRADTNSPPEFSTSAVMQLRVIVSWTESKRRREVILDSVKPN